MQVNLLEMDVICIMSMHMSYHLNGNNEDGALDAHAAATKSYIQRSLQGIIDEGKVAD